MLRIRLFCAALVLALSASSWAATPVIDVGAIDQILRQTIEDRARHAANMSALEDALNLDVVGHEDNANAAQEAALSGAAIEREDAQALHNKEVAERATPDRDDCVNQVHSGRIQQAEEDAALERATMLQTQQNIHRGALFGERSAADQTRDNASQIDDIVNWCGENDGCMDPTVLTTPGTPEGPVGDARRIAANLQVQVLTGAIARPKPRTVDINTTAGRADALRTMREEALRALASASLAAVAAENTPGAGGISPVGGYRAFVAQRFGSPAAEQWLKQTANTRGGETVMPSEVIRKIAVLDSFASHMAVRQYEQSLRMEALTAALLSLEVEPLR